MTLHIYVVYLLVLSFCAVVAYVGDKKRAQRGAWRIPEATLLSLSFFGGGLGGYIAVFLARHKTRKWYFHLVNIIGIIWQAALLVFLIKNPDILF